MAWIDLKFYSRTLERHVSCYALVPERRAARMPTYYLLHGRSDDHTIWTRRTRIEWHAQRYPMIVVMPDGQRGFYTDNEEGPAWTRFFCDDLIETIESILPARSGRSTRAVGGLSMGGYGALRLALGRPDLFISANSHSGAVLHGGKTWDKPEHREMRQIFGRHPAGSDHDLLALARRARRSKRLPALMLDCGVEDFLYEDNRAFHASLDKLGVAHEYREFPGAHNWDYWEAHVPEALAFHARALRIRPL